MKNCMLKTQFFFLVFFSFLIIGDDHLADESCKNITKETINEKSFTNTFNGTFNGKKIEYSASLKEKVIYEKENPNMPMASFFLYRVYCNKF